MIAVVTASARGPSIGSPIRDASQPNTRGATNFAASSTRLTRLFNRGNSLLPLPERIAGATLISRPIEVHSFESSAAAVSNATPVKATAEKLNPPSRHRPWRGASKKARQADAPASCPTAATIPKLRSGTLSTKPPRRGKAKSFTTLVMALNAATGYEEATPPSKATQSTGTAKPSSRAQHVCTAWMPSKAAGTCIARKRRQWRREQYAT
mmetsp:Transcript_90819/g.256513  ORF Transcript_90819/g.256513 Transcript_90819/m.256513 type:complete len:210 (-) Transcript_90819:7-636(-)